MASFSRFVVVSSLIWAALPGAAQSPAGRPKWSATLQTGFAETFQLTLGGTFGDGPAWQSRATVARSNVFSKNDSLSFSGWITHDLPGGANNEMVTLTYRALVASKNGHSLQLGGGGQYWNFPSVRCGTRDWLLSGALVGQTRIGKLPFIGMADSYSLLHSDLPKGSLVYAQFYARPTLYQHDQLAVELRVGPQYTYSWNFYGTNGSRVIRAAAMVMVSYKGTMIEGGWRKQFGLQPGIPDNGYWQFSVARSFSR